MTLLISIDYKTNDSRSSFSRLLSAEEYFDLECGELAELNSVPRFAHAIEYLSVDIATISETKLCIRDQTKDFCRTIIEKFWNAGKNRTIERIDSGAIGDYWELILVTQIVTSPPKWEIIRLGREQTLVKLLSHVFIEDQRDGTEQQSVVYRPP